MVRPRLFAFLLLTIASLAAPDAACANARGQYLARVGDCVSCHTAPGGKPYAGGLRMSMPFGAIYATNITPDRATGIGDWRFADFDRALRRGIAKDGHHLYPAMPYPSFATIDDADMRDLYDFIAHDLTPVRQANRAPDIVWPLDMRWPLAIWNYFFLDAGRFQADPSRDAAWNRGAYLVETLAHCGACHTPRSPAWNERAMDASDPRYLTGSILEFWSAPDLRGDLRTGLGAWTDSDIETFLKTAHNRHGASFGTMNYVTANTTSFLTGADRHAIAVFLKSLSPNHPGERVLPPATRHRHAADLATPGADLYRGNCARCHGMDGAGKPAEIPPLAGNPAILDPDPTSAIHIVLDGGKALSPDFPDAKTMPPFRRLLDDEALATIVTFIRQNWSNDAAPVGPAAIHAVRIGTRPPPDQIARGARLVAAKGCGACHTIPGISGATGLVGPPLDDIGDRATIAGLLANTPDNMAAWLQSPQRMKLGDAMPDIGLDATDARAIAAFLTTLRAP